MELTDKVVAVTGASKGIGRQMAYDFAREGADVAICARSGDLLETLAADIKKLGRKVFVYTGDMAVETEIKLFIQQTVETFGKLDILVNNAGLGHFYPVAEMSTELWDQMFNLNVRGLFIATREALPHLREAGESFVINIASLASKNSFATGGGYAATKHAVLGFSRCLMLEERKNGVRVLAICPGSVSTHFADHQPGLLAPEKKALVPSDISETVLQAIRLPQRAMVSEIDIRPSNP